ncbi:hypothetical protein EYF80_061615 [Liparis tanakae]|uniref:Uncharacterized protein n=1 Tax=Liparis tanakae TaxID=230148 RepID=A0A4Z2EHH4_9TELE|nr:hypothetical protein EYF80_061615 [Liparis tanakae]
MGDWTEEAQSNGSEKEKREREKEGGGNKSSKEGEEESRNTWRGKNKEVRGKGEEPRTRQPIGNVLSTCDILPDRVDQRPCPSYHSNRPSASDIKTRVWEETPSSSSSSKLKYGRPVPPPPPSPTPLPGVQSPQTLGPSRDATRPVKSDQ